MGPEHDLAARLTLVRSMTSKGGRQHGRQVRLEGLHVSRFRSQALRGGAAVVCCSFSRVDVKLML